LKSPLAYAAQGASHAVAVESFATVTAVPEPSACGFAILTMLSAAGSRNRRRRAAVE
jgi:hypothetical protein